MKPSSITSLPAWPTFSAAAQQADPLHNELRLIDAAGLTLDLSGQRYSPELAQAGLDLLEQRQFTEQRATLLGGGIANITENRAAWHSMLRQPAAIPDVMAERERLNAFIRESDLARRWRHIVHIGIGGSDWGIRLTVAAFGYTKQWRSVRFIANIDGHAVKAGLADLNPHDTLVVVASKSFTTAETLKNASRAIEWLTAANVRNPLEQVVAITARPEQAKKWGIPDKQIFRFWDWVGGRFSLWSSVSLTTALSVSSDVVAGMLSGAAAMDKHFETAPLALNAPVQMALHGLVNRSVLGISSLNLAPYDSRLMHLVPYLQQLEMESLGKSVDVCGEAVPVPTGPVVWGMPGTDAQHTFFQWLHQSSDGAAVDFIVCQEAEHQWPSHHQTLLANCLAQREAMLRGKTEAQAYEECLSQGHEPEQARWLAKHRIHQGGRANSLIVLPRLSPYHLGALIALYEHKVFVQAVLWGINPFDQWGVEYGKILATDITNELQNQPSTKAHDPSTTYWIDQFKARGA